MLNKYLNNIEGLKGRQIISLPGAPTCLCPALHMTDKNTSPEYTQAIVNTSTSKRL
jgi:hypothetical protein